jgi:hypothetical protein
MFCQLQDQGGASVASEIQTVAQEIADVQSKLNGVRKLIDEEVAKPKTSRDKEVLESLSKREDCLQDEMKRLGKREEQLRQKELILLQLSGANSNLCISSRFPPFSSLLSSSFASSHHPSSIPRFPCICLIFSSSECCWCRAFVRVWELEVFSACSFVCASVSTDPSRFCCVSLCCVSSCDFSICVTSVFVHSYLHFRLCLVVRLLNCVHYARALLMSTHTHSSRCPIAFLRTHTRLSWCGRSFR